MQPLKLILLVTATIAVSGCQLFTKTIYVDKPVPYLREPCGVTTPDPLILNGVDVILVKPSDGPAYFIIDPESYKNMMLNNKEIENYIRELNERVRLCEAYYNAPIDTAKVK